MIDDDDMRDTDRDDDQRRPLGMVLLGGLYLFFFMLTMSTFGHPFPLMGTLITGRAAEVIVFVDSLVCLYLFLGVMKRQSLTWYLLLGYNGFEIVNTVVNLKMISAAEIEKIVGQPVEPGGLAASNISLVVAVALLSLFIYRLRPFFNNRSRYLF